MTDCPGCGEELLHIGAVVPMLSTGPKDVRRRLKVLHFCNRLGCPETYWLEEARDPEAVMEKAGIQWRTPRD